MAPDAVPYDPDDLESPMAHEAQNSVVYGELEHCDCEVCQGVPS